MKKLAFHVRRSSLHHGEKSSHGGKWERRVVDQMRCVLKELYWLLGQWQDRASGHIWNDTSVKWWDPKWRSIRIKICGHLDEICEKWAFKEQSSFEWGWLELMHSDEEAPEERGCQFKFSVPSEGLLRYLGSCVPHRGLSPGEMI